MLRAQRIYVLYLVNNQAHPNCDLTVRLGPPKTGVNAFFLGGK